MPCITYNPKIFAQIYFSFIFLNKELIMQLFISKEGTHINVLKIRMRKPRMAPYRQFFVIVFLSRKT